MTEGFENRRRTFLKSLGALGVATAGPAVAQSDGEGDTYHQTLRADLTDEGLPEGEFGDGTTATGWWNAHRYDSPGTYTVALTATDNLGYSTTDEGEIRIS